MLTPQLCIAPQDVAPLQASITSLQQQTQSIFGLINASGRLGQGCAQTYQGEEWKCLFGEYRLPTLQTPYLLNAAQDDKFQLPWNIGGNSTLGFKPQQWAVVPALAGAWDYANSFAANMSAFISTLPTADQQAQGSALFSTACFHHCVTSSADFWNVAIAPSDLPPGAPAWATSARHGAGPSFSDALRAWLGTFGPDGPRPGFTPLVAACVGFRCGSCTTKLYDAITGGWALPPPALGGPLPGYPLEVGAAAEAPAKAAPQRRFHAMLVAPLALLTAGLLLASRASRARMADIAEEEKPLLVASGGGKQRARVSSAAAAEL